MLVGCMLANRMLVNCMLAGYMLVGCMLANHRRYSSDKPALDQRDGGDVPTIYR